MKEYTYTNKAYLGIKEGIVPPAPQYLWLNSKDDKLYKFGDGGWEIINNDNLYVADFTIEDLDSLTPTSPSIMLNARALIAALAAGKAIGIRQGNNESMSIASAFIDTNDKVIYLSVISGYGTMYKVHIDYEPAEDPYVLDSESGIIYYTPLQVISIKNPYFAPFDMRDVTGTVEGYITRVQKGPFVQNLMENKPLFIPNTSNSSQAVVPASYSITKQDGNPTAVDIDVVYNNGLYHMHLDLSTDSIIITSDNVSYTPLLDVYIVSEFCLLDIIDQSINSGPELTISRALLDAAYKGAPIMVKLNRTLTGASIPIIVDKINNPNEEVAIKFKVQYENIEYLVECRLSEVLTGNRVLKVTITTYNLVDWNENDSNITGYIANRTHYLTKVYQFKPSQTIFLQVYKSLSDIEDYRIKINENLYKLPKIKAPVTIGNLLAGLTLELESVTDDGSGRLTYVYNTTNSMGFSGEESLNIYQVEKTLDSAYLNNEALTWNYKTAQVVTGFVYFNTDNDGDGTVNQLYNKDLVMIDGSTVSGACNIMIGAEHHRPNTVKEYTFIVYNNTTDKSPHVTFVGGVGNIRPSQTRVVIGEHSPNCEIHVKLISSETSTLAVVEYKPFNS